MVYHQKGPHVNTRLTDSTQKAKHKSRPPTTMRPVDKNRTPLPPVRATTDGQTRMQHIHKQTELEIMKGQESRKNNNLDLFILRNVSRWIKKMLKTWKWKNIHGIVKIFLISMIVPLIIFITIQTNGDQASEYPSKETNRTMNFTHARHRNRFVFNL